VNLVDQMVSVAKSSFAVLACVDIAETPASARRFTFA